MQALADTLDTIAIIAGVVLIILGFVAGLAGGGGGGSETGGAILLAGILLVGMGGSGDTAIVLAAGLSVFKERIRLGTPLAGLVVRLPIYVLCALIAAGEPFALGFVIAAAGADIATVGYRHAGVVTAVVSLAGMLCLAALNWTNEDNIQFAAPAWGAIGLLIITVRRVWENREATQ